MLSTNILRKKLAILGARDLPSHPVNFPQRDGIVTENRLSRTAQLRVS
jgi:hypothetical protein